MKKILGLIIIAFLIGCFSQTGASQSEGNSDLKKYEIGGHFTFLGRVDANAAVVTIQRNLSNSGSSGSPSISEFGFGARFTYNFTRYAAIEVEGNLFPQDRRSNLVLGRPIRVIEPGGRKLQAVAGPKIGYRGEKFGIFGKFRTGLIRLDRYDAVTQIGPPDNFFVLSETRKKVGFLNFDLGGVVEYYPTKSTVFRVDVGDTIIHYRRLPPKEINPSITRHNLQVNLGFGFRF